MEILKSHTTYVAGLFAEAVKNAEKIILKREDNSGMDTVKKLIDLTELMLLAHDLRKAEEYVSHALKLLSNIPEDPESLSYQAYFYSRLKGICYTLGRLHEANTAKLEELLIKEKLLKMKGIINDEKVTCQIDEN